jgi:hypothetical protein
MSVLVIAYLSDTNYSASTAVFTISTCLPFLFDDRYTSDPHALTNISSYYSLSHAVSVILASGGFPSFVYNDTHAALEAHLEHTFHAPPYATLHFGFRR